MGTIYYVGCRDCKTVRILDKFYAMREAKTKQEAIKLSEDLVNRPGASYRAALLVAFMWEHRGHNCTAFNEHDQGIMDIFCDDGDCPVNDPFWE